MKRFVVGLALVLIPGVAYAGGGGVDTSGCAGYSEGTSVSMKDSCFSGTAHFAPRGMAISIDNQGSLPHTLTSVDGSFDTGQIAPGGSTDLTFDEPGIYQFFCTLHGTPGGEGMAGVLVVGEPAPGTVAASLDTSALVDAFATENEGLVEAMDRQGRAMGEIRAAQREVAEALEELTTAPSQSADAGPDVVASPSQPDSAAHLIAVSVGVAGGLAVAALVTALSLRRRDVGLARLDRFEPSPGS